MIGITNFATRSNELCNLFTKFATSNELCNLPQKRLRSLQHRYLKERSLQQLASKITMFANFPWWIYLILNSNVYAMFTFLHLIRFWLCICLWVRTLSSEERLFIFNFTLIFIGHCRLFYFDMLNCYVFIRRTRHLANGSLRVDITCYNHVLRSTRLSSSYTTWKCVLQ